MRNLLRIHRKLWLIACVALVGTISTLQLVAQDLSNAELFAGLSFRSVTLASDYLTAPGVFASPGTPTTNVGFAGLKGGVGLRLNSSFSLVADTSVYLKNRRVVTPRACSQPSQGSVCFRTGSEIVSLYEFLGGLRVSKPGKSVMPFFHIMFGPVGGSPLGGGDSGVAAALGGGVELGSRRAPRIALRIQIEDVPKRFSNRWTNDVQIAFGPVFRFGKRK